MVQYVLVQWCACFVAFLLLVFGVEVGLGVETLAQQTDNVSIMDRIVARMIPAGTRFHLNQQQNSL